MIILVLYALILASVISNLYCHLEAVKLSIFIVCKSDLVASLTASENAPLIVKSLLIFTGIKYEPYNLITLPGLVFSFTMTSTSKGLWSTGEVFVIVRCFLVSSEGNDGLAIIATFVFLSAGNVC